MSVAENHSYDPVEILRAAGHGDAADLLTKLPPREALATVGERSPAESASPSPHPMFQPDPVDVERQAEGAWAREQLFRSLPHLRPEGEAA